MRYSLRVLFLLPVICFASLHLIRVLTPPPIEELQERAERLLDEGDYDEFKLVAEEIIRLYPEEPLARLVELDCKHIELLERVRRQELIFRARLRIWERNRGCRFPDPYDEVNSVEKGKPSSTNPPTPTTEYIPPGLRASA
ncbi:hypothetical protein [Aeoliella sp.]|uniref:hypothetical protein n=1 Tax=Aeoliella sp. TaxID=2795800 RepID=UPI003CCC00BF